MSSGGMDGWIVAHREKSGRAIRGGGGESRSSWKQWVKFFSCLLSDTLFSVCEGENVAPRLAQLCPALRGFQRRLHEQDFDPSVIDAHAPRYGLVWISSRRAHPGTNFSPSFRPRRAQSGGTSSRSCDSEVTFLKTRIVPPRAPCVSSCGHSATACCAELERSEFGFSPAHIPSSSPFSTIRSGRPVRSEPGLVSKCVCARAPAFVVTVRTCPSSGQKGWMWIESQEKSPSSHNIFEDEVHDDGEEDDGVGADSTVCLHSSVDVISSHT